MVREMKNIYMLLERVAGPLLIIEERSLLELEGPAEAPTMNLVTPLTIGILLD